MFDQRSINNLADVNMHPIIVAKTKLIEAECELAGFQIQCTQAFRTVAMQDADYAKGRTVPPIGPQYVVTKAKGSDYQSYHQFGLAVDLIPGIRSASLWEPNWNPNHPDYKTMIAIGIKHGLDSGSTWKSIKDYPHFQYPGLTSAPTAAEIAIMKSAGLSAVWDTLPVFQDPDTN
jgi:peptidoglycan L-alanyl-D-glutamate endopeptidase CwlK